MAQEKEERSGGRTTATHSTSAHSRSGPREAAGAADSGMTAAAPGRRPERYIIGTRALPGAQPLAYPQHSMDEVVEYLGRMEDVEVVKRIRLGGAQPFTTGGGFHEVVVARFDEARAQRLRAAAPAHLIIEPDWLLAGTDCLPVTARATPIATLLPLRSVASEISVRVVGERDQPLAHAMVVIEGGGFPVQALTDDSGTARITFFGGPIDAIQTLFVRAAANHWDRLLSAPRLSSGTNTVKLRPLSELHPNFPGTRLLGWGQRLMGLDPTGGRFTGSGVRIGVIDSGCDNSHPLLRHISHGKDFTSGGTDTSWSQDLLSHGTHCAGIINAASTEQGIVGCAPGAELHVFKVMPHGRISDLLAALHECIERELDLIHISVASDGFSELVAQKLREARLKGIACIAAAGNTGGPVAFPAMLPATMAVAAVGRLREFPSDSSHVLSVLPHLIGSDDVFAAGFSAAGPQVAVSAPGVAVVSTVPGGGYAAADRTSAAAAHVTGLAALVLAHHPAFQDGLLRARSEQRVHALFELIRASAVARFAHPQHGGAGVPYLPRIPGSHGLVMGLAAADGVERIAMPQYWPGPIQGWPAWLQPPASGFF
ncbi:MAG: serine protease [Gammaproteobacteria bacterium]|nr:MAG: serine protease [Gammaproteobacteria bacterium]